MTPRKSIKDIAALAGVSIGTVDRVLHSRGRVAPETEARIRRIIEESDYRPNLFASALKTGRPCRIGVLMPRPGPYGAYWDLPLVGVRRAAQELKPLNVRVETFFFDAGGGEPRLSEALAALLASDPDGCLMAPVRSDDWPALVPLLPETKPYVFFDSFLPGAHPRSVIAQDGYRAGRTAGRLLDLLLPGGGEVLILRHLPSDHHLRERERGVLDHLAARPGFTWVIEELDLAALGQGLKTRLAVIRRRHPGFKGLFVTNANVTPVLDLVRVGAACPRPVCVGFDLLAPNLDALHRGEIDFLISQQPESYGYLGVTALYRHLVLGEAIAPLVRTPVEIVCRDNAPGGPLDSPVKV